MVKLMIKIFLVEDEIIVREGIKNLIPWEEYGCSLEGEAPDGEIALPMIKKIQPDIVITDIKMSFMDGLAMARIIKRDLPETHIVLISGYDDFKYAREAMEIGINHYLLKPVTRDELLKTIQSIRAQIESKREKQNYFAKFRLEMQAYEKFERREFFERLISGTAPAAEIIDMARQLKLDITSADSYGIVLFRSSSLGPGEIYSDEAAKMQQRIEEMFSETDNYILFKDNINSYAVLVLGENGSADAAVAECARRLINMPDENGEICWYVSRGAAVNRISLIASSYHDAADKLVRSIAEGKCDADEFNPAALDASTLEQTVIEDFLKSGLKSETEDFVRDYLNGIGREHLGSMLFRQYVALNAQFTATAFIQRLGASKTDFLNKGGPVSDFRKFVGSAELTEEYLCRLLNAALELRDECSVYRNKPITEDAIKYIAEHFCENEISLNSVAKAINVSPAHFSSVFSREVGKTFVEYLTAMRMRRAKELLRCTDIKSSAIALEVGYNDPHYFSFLFKKTQGCTPRDYRNGRRAANET